MGRDETATGEELGFGAGDELGFGGGGELGFGAGAELGFGAGGELGFGAGGELGFGAAGDDAGGAAGDFAGGAGDVGMVGRREGRKREGGYLSKKEGRNENDKVRKTMSNEGGIASLATSSSSLCCQCLPVPKFKGGFRITSKCR
jgi:hypothetical protein